MTRMVILSRVLPCGVATRKAKPTKKLSAISTMLEDSFPKAGGNDDCESAETVVEYCHGESSKKVLSLL